MVCRTYLLLYILCLTAVLFGISTASQIPSDSKSLEDLNISNPGETSHKREVLTSHISGIEECTKEDFGQMWGRSYRKCTVDHYYSCLFADFYKCDENTNNCLRKGLFPILDSEIVGYILMFFIILFANFSGVGGGCSCMILFYFSFRFEFNKCILYTAYINLIAGIIRFVLFLKEKHPKKTYRTLINYDLVISILPIAILGYFTGNIVFGVISMFVASVFIIVIYGGISFNLFTKGIRDYFLEKKIYNSIQQKRELEKRLYHNNDQTEESNFTIEDNRKIKQLTHELKNDEKHFSLNNKDENEVKHPSFLNPPSEYIAQDNAQQKDIISPAVLARLDLLESEDEYEDKDEKELIYKLQKSISAKPSAWNSKGAVNSNEIKQFEQLVFK